MTACGAAAAVLCSDTFLARLSTGTRQRVVRLAAQAMVTDTRESFDDACARTPFDASSALAGVKMAEMAARKCYRMGGRVVVNSSGGLESKGHPIGATGLAQCHELVTQLRHEAGKRQVPPGPELSAQTGMRVSL
ncbi:unnamed protein product [Sphagnum balticum]